MSKIKILVIPSDRTGVSWFRSTAPHVHLEKMFPDEFHVDIDYEPDLNNDAFLKQYHIIHYHRQLGPFEQTEQLLAKLKSFGIKTIMDVDDYWAPGVHHPAFQIIKDNQLDKKIQNNVRLAETVSTTTPVFADEIRKFCKNVVVFPNAIDPTEKQFIPNPEPSTNGRLRIGWLGGSSHLYDLELLRGIVSKLKSDNLLDQVQFVLCGYDLRGVMNIKNAQTGEVTTRNIYPHESVWYKYEQIFTGNYNFVSPEYKAHLLKFSQESYANEANEPYRRVWTMQISTYATNYNLFDVSLAPLAENKFNKMKSQLKVIEAGFHKKALIAQDFGPYQIDLISYGKGDKINPDGNALLVDSTKNHKQWYQYIKMLILDRGLVTELSQRLHDTVKDTYHIDTVTKARREFYKQLVAVPAMV